MRTIFLYWLPAALWMGLLFVLSAQPELPMPPGPWLQGVIDKIGHAVSYGVLAWLLWRALRRHFPSSVALGVACTALAIVYGASDEFHQSFVPGRTPSAADLAADGLGAACATLLLMWRDRRKARPQSSPGAR